MPAPGARRAASRLWLVQLVRGEVSAHVLRVDRDRHHVVQHLAPLRLRDRLLEALLDGRRGGLVGVKAGTSVDRARLNRQLRHPVVPTSGRTSSGPAASPTACGSHPPRRGVHRPRDRGPGGGATSRDQGGARWSCHSHPAGREEHPAPAALSRRSMVRPAEGGRASPLRLPPRAPASGPGGGRRSPEAAARAARASPIAGEPDRGQARLRHLPNPGAGDRGD